MKMEATMPNHKNLRFGTYALVLVYFIAVVLSGALIAAWTAPLLGNSFYLPYVAWAFAWYLEFDVFTSAPPHRSRDWIAHIAGVSVAISGATAYLFLATRFSFLLNRNVQFVCNFSLIFAQLGTLS